MLLQGNPLESYDLNFNVNIAISSSVSSELYQVANYGLAGHYYSHYDQVKQQLIQVEGVDIVNIVIIKVLILSILLSSRC